MRPRRVVVVGNSGAGKSRLSAVVGERWGLPVVYLDPLFWGPGWVQPELAQWRQRVAEVVAEDTWVVDGNYGSTLDLRLPRAALAEYAPGTPVVRLTSRRAVRRWLATA